MKYFYPIVVCMLLLRLTTESVSAQDPQFSQEYAAPMYLNPALCGDTYMHRIAMNYRNQWSAIPKGYQSYSASYDHRFRKSQTGIGISFLRDVAGVQSFRYTDVALHLSTGVKLGYKSGFRMGMRLGSGTRDHDQGGLLFWDQVARNSPSTIEPFLMSRVSYFDAGAGGLLYTKKMWAGVSAMHLNRPVYTLIDNNTRQPVKFSAHVGYKINVSSDSALHAATINPVIHYKWQQDWKQLDIGAYWSKRKFLLGMWYRGIPIKKDPSLQYLGHDALVLLAGLEVQDKFRIGYSYDMSISRLYGRSGGSHEISIMYEWPTEQMKQDDNIIPCPKF